MTRASGGANNIRPLSWGAQTKIIPDIYLLPIFHSRPNIYQNRKFSCIRRGPRRDSIYKKSELRSNFSGVT